MYKLVLSFIIYSLPFVSWALFKDPTQPPASALNEEKAEEEKVEYILKGIRLYDGKQEALINDKWVGVGEMVAELQVKRITSTMVLLEADGWQKVLVLSKQVKQ